MEVLFCVDAVSSCVSSFHAARGRFASDDTLMMLLMYKALSAMRTQHARTSRVHAFLCSFKADGTTSKHAVFLT